MNPASTLLTALLLTALLLTTTLTAQSPAPAEKPAMGRKFAREKFVSLVGH